MVLSLITFPVAADGESLEAHFIDVGQGDAILLHSSDGTDILIDGGYPDKGNKILIYMKRLGIKDLDLVIGSHPHADHIGGLVKVIKNFSVKEVLDPGVVYSTGIFEEYLTTIKEEQIPFRTALAGDIINFENSNLKMKVLAPYKGQLNYGDDINDVSFVIKVVYGEVSFLLTGDAGFDTEDKLVLNKVDIDSDILKVGHHGSRYSSSNMFLSTVSPEVAVIQVGANNTYGHPTTEALTRLRRKGVQEDNIYRNDLHGTVIITTDGQDYHVKTEKTIVKEDDNRVNLNLAPMGDIIEVPGINYEMANEIIDYRKDFGYLLNITELVNSLDSITPEIADEISPYIKFAE